jgi:arginyl-tRNA synthetase
MIDFAPYIIAELQKLLATDLVPPVITPSQPKLGDLSVACFTLVNDDFPQAPALAAFLAQNFSDPQHYFARIQAVGPYLNFFLQPDTLFPVITDIEQQGSAYGSRQQGAGQQLLIEHTSINPNASPHIGRIRNSLIGDFLSRLYQFVGYQVQRHYFINDIGKQIAMLLVGVEQYGHGDTSNFERMLDWYIRINEASKTDPAISEQVFNYLHQLENGDRDVQAKFKALTDACVAGQTEILRQLDITFDVFTHESDYVFNRTTQDILDQIKAKGKLATDDHGRFYVDLTGYRIPTKSPVLVLTREDGTSLYSLRDIAYSIYKLQLNSQHNFIVLGEDQTTYMKQIAATLDILGYPAPQLISYAFVLLAGNKMATRSGTIVLLTDLIHSVTTALQDAFATRDLPTSAADLHIIANACIKYSILNVSRSKNVNFHLENAISFTGDTGLYLLYCVVRINSILAKNPDQITTDQLQFTTSAELQLLRDLAHFPVIVDELLASQQPAHLTKYLHQLAQKFAQFYESTHISSVTDPVRKSSQLRLLQCLHTVITTGLHLLGINTVTKI